MRDHPELAPLFWLALFGFGVKAGLFPLHIWLPSAHANAPSHVSAMLSGVTLKMGIYGLVRFSGWLPVPAGGGLGGGGAGRGQRGPGRGLCAGAARSQAPARLSQRRKHRHHSHRAWLRAGGGATGQRRLGPAGAGRRRCCMCGTTGLFKSLLFFGAGSVLHATGTREMSRLGGLWRAMPWTASLVRARRGGDFRAAAAQRICQRMAGVSRPVRRHACPRPLGLGGDSGGHSARRDRRAGAGVFCEGLRRGFSGRSAFRGGGAGARKRPGDARRRCWCWARRAWRSASRRSSSGRRWRGRWRCGIPPGPEPETPAALSSLGAFHVALAVLALAAAGWLWRRVRRGGLTRALTWDCGYAAPDGRGCNTRRARSRASSPNGSRGFCARNGTSSFPKTVSRASAQSCGAHAGDGAGKNCRAGGAAGHARFDGGAAASSMGGCKPTCCIC